ncbi:MAG: helix-turn-helix domain-containing protein [Actinomycetota bacterium]
MLTVPEVAKRTGRNAETIRRWIREGKLRARKVGTQHVIEEEDLESLLDDGLLPAPAGWDRLFTGDPMPNWEAIIRRQRAER